MRLFKPVVVLLFAISTFTATNLEADVRGGNEIFTVSVAESSSDYCGAWTATTGPKHPAGENLDVLFGAGTARTSTTTFKSYTSGIEYVTGHHPGCSRLCQNAAPVVSPILNGGKIVGYRLLWSFRDGAQGPKIEFEQEVHVSGPVDGTETVDNTVIRETHTVRNLGPGDLKFGLRKLWDWQIGGDDGPHFGDCANSTTACDASMNLTPDGSLSGRYPRAYVINSDPALTACPTGTNPIGGNCVGSPPYIVSGTVAPTSSGLFPPPSPPELLQFNDWSNLSSECWQPSLHNDATCGGGDDTAVAYFYGLTGDSAIVLAEGQERSFTQYVTAAKEGCPLDGKAECKGEINDVPAATLLLPYFEVDIDKTQKLPRTNTGFSINNAAPTATLAHVNVWSDQSFLVLTFNVYLTGYDIETINLREIFVNGNLPRTAPYKQDERDTLSPGGPVSLDSDFPSCEELPYPASVIPANVLSHLHATLQGERSPITGLCAGSKKKDEDNILRGYITIDVVNACTRAAPQNWEEYSKVLSNQNVLWGQYYYISEAQRSILAENLVSIEACPTCFSPGDHTFYGRYNGASAEDAREPLPTTLAARFHNATGLEKPEFLVWRETYSPGVEFGDLGYTCNLDGPSWYPLPTRQVVAFDETETPYMGEVQAIPNAANQISDIDLGVPWRFGWVYLNLQHPNLNPAYGDQAAQGWVTVRMRTYDGLTGFDALQLDCANAPVLFGIPVK